MTDEKELPTHRSVYLRMKKNSGFISYTSSSILRFCNRGAMKPAQCGWICSILTYRGVYIVHFGHSPQLDLLKSFPRRKQKRSNEVIAPKKCVFFLHIFIENVPHSTIAFCKVKPPSHY